MIFDIAITLFIIIGLIIGLFRNPLMSIIHTILFVCFSFLFFPLLSALMPKILEMNNINLSDFASMVANAISMVNNELVDFGKNIGVNLATLPSIYTSPSFLEGALKGISNSFSFLISSFLSLIISYIVSWIIYLLIKRYVVEFDKIKHVKFFKRSILSFSFTFLFIFFSLSFIFSPYQNIKNSYDDLFITFNNINLMEKIESEYNDVTSLINNIKKTDNELSILNDKLIKMDKKVESYYDLNIDYFIKLDSLNNTKEELINTIDESLLDSSISTNNKIKLNEYKNNLLSLDKTLTTINELIFKDDDIIYTFDNEFLLLNEKINIEKEKFNNALNMFSLSVDKINTLESDLNKYLNELDSINNKFIKSNWYNFLFSIDYGYMNYLYNGRIYNLKEEVNNFIINFNNTLSEDISFLKSYFNKEVKIGNDKLYEMEEKIDSYNDNITSKESSFNGFIINKDETNNKIEDLLNEIENTLTKIKEDLSTLA